MDERTLRALIDAGALKRIRIIANGGAFYVEAEHLTNTVTVHTTTGKLKTWVTLDAVARWLKNLGIGKAQLELANWQPGQKGLEL
ncbi:MAG TPA: hypothetical protein VMH83_06200 [Candidatus Acidoferrum sp.]|nr:hypothetical protein [Candidatus Acidoferrum sp.]